MVLCYQREIAAELDLSLYTINDVFRKAERPLERNWPAGPRRPGRPSGGL
jgi:hypothetical protein